MPQLNKYRVNRLPPKAKVLPLQTNVCETSKTISFDEHRKVLNRNAVIVKENAFLKDQIRKLKNENINLRANETHSDPKVLESVVIAFKLVFDEYRNLKSSLQNMVVSLDSFNDILSHCSSFFRDKYPNYNIPEFENDNGFNEFWQTCDQINQTSGGLQNNSRYSMSSQERESRRKYSMDKNKNAFRIFSELSTILEISADLRSSSGKPDSIPRLSIIGRKSNVRKSSIRCLSSNVPTIQENCELENENNICLSQEKNQSINTINAELISNIINNSEQLFDINKVVAQTQPSNRRFIGSLDRLSLTEPQHCSSPITNQLNEQLIPKDKTIIENEIDITFSNVLADKTGKCSTGSLLVEETRYDYSELISKKSSVLSLSEIKETPISKLNPRIEKQLETVALETEWNDESAHITCETERNASQTSSNIEDTTVTVTVTETSIRPKRNLRNANKINYAGMCIDSNIKDDEAIVRRKRKQNQTQSQSKKKEAKQSNSKVKRKSEK